MMADENNSGERGFYEQTRFKVVASIFIASIGLAALAFCSAYAGQSDAARIAADNSSGTSKDYNESLSSGYGKGVTKVLQKPLQPYNRFLLWFVQGSRRSSLSWPSSSSLLEPSTCLLCAAERPESARS
jgi:hypothetical protein